MLPFPTFLAAGGHCSTGSLLRLDGTIAFLNRVLFTPPTVPDVDAHATCADVTGSIRNYRDPIFLPNLSVQKPFKPTES
jgi:hypothetical protein